MKASKQAKFKRVFWGFNPSQVRQELARMAESQEEGALRYRQQIDQLQAELDRLTEKAAGLQEQLQQFQQRENLLAETLLAAQAEANQIIHDAQKEADALVDSARAEMEGKRAQLLAVEQRQALFMSQFGKLYDQLQQHCSLILNPVADTAAMMETLDEEAYQPFIPGNLSLEDEGGEMH